MLVLRVLGALLIVVLGAAGAAYLITHDRRWLRFSMQIVKIGVLIILIIFALMALERLAIVTI